MDDKSLHRVEPPDTFEAGLRTALRRVEAPAGFTERVLAKAGHHAPGSALPHGARAGTVANGSKRGVLLQLSRPVWRLAYAAAALLAITAGVAQFEHVRVERERADRAAAQFDEAMQVTSHALQNVTTRLQQTQFGDLEKALDRNSGGGQ